MMESHRSSPSPASAASPRGGWLPAPLCALIMASLARLFARLEQMLRLWQSGAFPVPSVRHTLRRIAQPRKPGAHAPRHRLARRRHHIPHIHRAPTPAPRPIPVTRTPSIARQYPRAQPRRPHAARAPPGDHRSHRSRNPPLEGQHPRAYRVPVLPNPPAPRAVSSSSATSTHPPRTTGASTACAIRIPRSTTNGSCPAFITITCNSPR